MSTAESTGSIQSSGLNSNGIASCSPSSSKFIMKSGDENGYHVNSFKMKNLNGTSVGNVFEKPEEDIVILDHNNLIAGKELTDVQKQGKDSNNSANARLLSASTKCKFEINDKVRNSLKDLICKVQDSSPALSTLSGTKAARMASQGEKTDVREEQGDTSTSSGRNLFDNLKKNPPNASFTTESSTENSDNPKESPPVQLESTVGTDGPLRTQDQDVILVDESDEGKKSPVKSLDQGGGDACIGKEHFCDTLTSCSSNGSNRLNESLDSPHDSNTDLIAIDNPENPNDKGNNLKSDDVKNISETDDMKNSPETEDLASNIESDDIDSSKTSEPNSSSNLCTAPDEDQVVCVESDNSRDNSYENPCEKKDDSEDSCTAERQEKEEEDALLCMDEKEEKSTIEKMDNAEEEILLASDEDNEGRMETDCLENNDSSDVQEISVEKPVTEDNCPTSEQVMDEDAEMMSVEKDVESSKCMSSGDDDDDDDDNEEDDDEGEDDNDDKDDDECGSKDKDAVENKPETNDDSCVSTNDDGTQMSYDNDAEESSCASAKESQESSMEEEDEEKKDSELKSEIKAKEEFKEKSESGSPCGAEKIENESEVETLERKRQASSPQEVTAPKRSRLDEMIGKLGSQIGIKPENVSELKEEEVSEEEGSEITESAQETDDTQFSSSPEDGSPRKTSRRKIRVTEEELEKLVQVKVKKIVCAEKLKWMQEMSEKLTELLNSNETWKHRFKETEKNILDVTILQQTHEKRKAKTAALRQISTKNIGTQVDGKLIMAALPPLGYTPKTPPHGTPSVNASGISSQTVGSPSILPVNSAANVIVTPFTVANGAINTQMMSVPTMKTPAQLAVASGIAAASANIANKQALKAGTMVNNSNIVVSSGALGNKIIGTGVPPGFIPVLVANSPTMGTQTRQVTSVTTPGRKDKVIDLTNEEESRKLLPSLPLLQAQSGTTGDMQKGHFRPQLINNSSHLNSNAGGILVNNTGQLIGTSTPQTIQLVFNSASPAIRPGSIVTVVTAPPPAMRQMAAAPVMATPSAGIMAAVPANQTSMMNTQNIRQILNLRKPPPLMAAGQSPATFAASPAASPKVMTSIPKVITTFSTATTSSASAATSKPTSAHPAPLPLMPANQVRSGQKPLPPKPSLKISRVAQGIVLSWNMVLKATPHADIQAYQLFAYQEGSSPPNTSLWKKVGDVKALPLPMACTLTQFQEGNKYHFAVRAVDIHSRLGPFSDPSTIHLIKKS